MGALAAPANTVGRGIGYAMVGSGRWGSSVGQVEDWKWADRTVTYGSVRHVCSKVMDEKPLFEIWRSE